MLAGNVVALLSPLVFVPVLTYAFGPQNYDYKSMAAIRLGNDEDIAAAANTDLEQIPGVTGMSAADFEVEQKKLKRASLIAKSLTGFMTIAFLILWPMPLYGTGYIFSKKFFTGYVHFRINLFLIWTTLRVAKHVPGAERIRNPLGLSDYSYLCLEEKNADTDNSVVGSPWVYCGYSAARFV